MREIKFHMGDTVIFDPNSLNPKFWNNLSDNNKRKYYGDIYNLDNPDRPFLFTFMTEHSPQEGHCVLINMKNQKVETMRHTSDFRLAEEEEC